MTTTTRFDFPQFDVSGATISPVRPHPQQQLLAGMEDTLPVPRGAPQRAQVTPLDERLQPCGMPFSGEVERRSTDSMALWHARPVRAPYLAVDVPMTDGREERVILRVTQCESFGLDYAIRGDVMGS
jgi:hypothetical protein